MEPLARRDYKDLLSEAGAFHGDVCGGIEIGTRMTMAGLKRIGITDPKGEDKKNLMVFVEVDRCATDAIMALTGCRPGKRTMKVLDYGKMAATFINLETRQAVRVVVKRQGGGNEEKADFGAMDESELFSITDVTVPLKPEDLPGRPVRRVVCAGCGESVMDGREVAEAGRALCKPCAASAFYYIPIEKEPS